MPSAFDRLSDLLRALEDERVRYVLFGGQAVNLHGIPRFTEDIDLFVEPTADNVERLRRALTRVWNDPEIQQIRAEDLAGEYAVVRVGEAFRFEDVESETLMLGGLPVRIATPRMLYRMKKDTLRPIDHADAADLKAKFALRDD